MSEARPVVKTSVGDATEADIQADMAELMQASNFGAPTDQQRWGLTGQPMGQPDSSGSSMAGLELQAEIAKQQALASALQSLAPNQIPDQDPNNEAAHWRKLYGDGENEKGELRRQLEQAQRDQAAQNEMMNQLLQSLQAPSYGAPQAAFRAPYQQAQPAYPYQEPRNPLEGRGDDDIISVRDVRRLIDEEVKPAVQGLHIQTMQMMDHQQAMQRRAVAAISALDEFQLTRENPWVQGLPSESQRVDALIALKRVKTQAAVIPQQVAQQVQTQATQNVAPIVRRLTSVEQSTQQAPDLTGDAISAAFQRDLAAAKQLPEENGARAKAMRQIAAKYNLPVGSQSDMGLMRSQVIV